MRTPGHLTLEVLQDHKLHPALLSKIYEWSMFLQTCGWQHVMFVIILPQLVIINHQDSSTSNI
jgi:hypothetical protein